MIFGKKKKIPDTKTKPPGDTPTKSGTVEGGASMWVSKGNNLVESGMYAEAIQCYDKLLAANPADANTWCSKSDVLFEAGKYEEAIESYDKALEINPRIEKIWSNKGLAIAKMNEKKEKIDLQKIAATLPKEVKAVPKNSA